MKTNRLLLLLSLTCAATALAVDPPPDGGYPNQNTAAGEDSLFSLTTGIGNTSVGYTSLYSDTTGGYNTAIGFAALIGNTTGAGNTALGWDALFSNSTGLYNTATGANALLSNTVGNFNSAIGYVALALNTTGLNNMAAGYGALYNNTTGTNNTACGSSALAGVTTGRSNIGLGYSAGSKITSGSNNIEIDHKGVTENESGTIRIGNKVHKKTFIQGINGVTVADGVGVIIDTNGQLGTITSSKRFKDAIKPIGDASETILALRPVKFRYKHELDPVGIPQFGLVAEEVAKVDPDLVARDEEGKPSTVRYEAVNAMLLNEFLKEHRKLEKLEAIVTRLEATVEKQAAQIDKVSAQVQSAEPDSRLVSTE